MKKQNSKVVADMQEIISQFEGNMTFGLIDALPRITLCMLEPVIETIKDLAVQVKSVDDKLNSHLKTHDYEERYTNKCTYVLRNDNQLMASSKCDGYVLEGCVTVQTFERGTSKKNPGKFVSVVTQTSTEIPF